MASGTPEEPFKFDYVVAWADTDALGIMHFSNYFKLCERAEQFYFESKKLEGRGVFLPRVHASCDYSYPLRYKQRARVNVILKEIGNRHITFEYLVNNETEGKISARCRIVVVPVNEKMEPSNLNKELVSKLVQE